MTLSEHNEACRLQRQMKEQGFCEEVQTLFAKCLPNERTGSFDPTAVEIFENWALLHPNLQDALQFIKDVLHQRPVPTLEARLSGAL